jgi:hypothetical protein
MSTSTPARRLRRGRELGLAALLLATITAGLALVTGSPASALPLCGGNQNQQMAPITCTNSRTIDGTTFTVVLDVAASGVVTATYTLDAPRAADTPIRIRSHQGISSQPLVHEVSGVIAAGATTGSLTTTLNCGQIDVKAVFTDNGDARGRIAAPYVTEANSCQVAPTTTGATTVPTTAPPTGPTTIPPTGPTTVPASVSPTSAGASTTAASSSGALPTTGAGTGLLVVSAVLVLVGIVLVTKSRRGDAIPQ